MMLAELSPHEQEGVTEPALSPVPSDMLTERAYDYLQKAILNLELPPGSKLNVGRLAHMVQLSPTPIKQALMRLAGEGLVTQHPHRGFRVSSPSVDSIEELYDLRAMCELHAADRIAAQPPGGFIQRLTELEEEFERFVEDPAKIRERLLQDREFHCYVVDQAGSARLSRWFRGLSIHAEAARLVRRRSGLSAEYADTTVDEHRRIVAAFAANNGDAVRQAISNHLAESRKRSLHDLSLVLQQLSHR